MITEPKKEIKTKSSTTKENVITSKQIPVYCIVILLLCFSVSLIQSKEVMIQQMQIIGSNTAKDSIVKMRGEAAAKKREEGETSLTLNALSACLMDASNGRILYGKDEEREMPMASTTKIMTLLVVLEQANLQDVVTVSSNAARQPDVQLNICTGEQYILRDLLYSLMLESHNDSAVAIAEHVGGSVEGFCNMMTQKAQEIGAYHTQFKTPNGLDAEGHYTTARDLSLIASYAIQKKEFCDIIQTQTHQFDSVDKKRCFHVNNKNRFLYMMDGAIGVKTGFTGKAGYCFVGAIRINDKTFVSTVLGSGWPPHKEYKWADTKKLMNYGLENYEMLPLFHHTTQEALIEIPNTVKVINGKVKEVKIRPVEDLRSETLLLSPYESVSIQLEIRQEIQAPQSEGYQVGSLVYLIDDRVYKIVPVTTVTEIEDRDFPFIVKQIFSIW